MGLASLQADIINHRIENRAAVLDEYQPSFTQGDWRASQGVTLGWRPIRPAVLIAARELLDRLSKECAERLAREMTLVYSLNEQRSRVQAVHYLSKGEAAEMTKAVMGGELLDLDCGYGGMLLRDNYISDGGGRLTQIRTRARGASEWPPRGATGRLELGRSVAPIAASRQSASSVAP